MRVEMLNSVQSTLRLEQTAIPSSSFSVKLAVGKSSKSHKYENNCGTGAMNAAAEPCVSDEAAESIFLEAAAGLLQMLSS